jgi:gliding motility-associated-like protein
LPDLHASPLKADILPGEEVQLVATSHDSVVWSPATALSCTNCPMPVATPDDDITYMVITGDPKTGCIDSAYITIIVEGSFYVPNTFTPNGDYINQIFKPVCMKVYDYTMMIFDRWGNHIFTTTDTEIGWDGTFHGKPCQEDVYVYKIEYMQKHSTGLHSVSGHVNLVR